MQNTSGSILPNRLVWFFCARIQGGSDRIRVFLHRGFVTLDALDEADLGSGAVEVVSGTVDAEVDVTVDKVGQESETDCEGHQLAGERH